MLMGKGGDMSTNEKLGDARLALFISFLIIIMAAYFTEEWKTKAEKYKAMAHEFCLSASGGEENICKEALKNDR